MSKKHLFQTFLMAIVIGSSVTSYAAEATKLPPRAMEAPRGLRPPPVCGPGWGETFRGPERIVCEPRVAIKCPDGWTGPFKAPDREYGYQCVLPPK